MTVVRNVSSGPNDVENLLWLPPLGTQKNAVTSSRKRRPVELALELGQPIRFHGLRFRAESRIWLLTSRLVSGQCRSVLHHLLFGGWA